MAKVKNSSNIGLISSIVFASLAVSASLVFLGFQLSENDKGMTDDQLETAIFEGIDSYIAEKQAEYENGGAAAPQAAVITENMSDDDAFIGDANAPITIVEFSDYECPYCEAFVNGALPQIKEKYIETGMAKLVYRDYPLSFHKGAYPSALAAECVRDQAGDEGYFKMHDVIFANQSDLSNENLNKLALDLGVDNVKYSECFDSEKFREEIYADLAEGQAVGISGTPGFIIDGKIISGAQPFSVFEAAVEEALTK
jgi:protein-disulfide isomerase